MAPKQGAAAVRVPAISENDPAWRAALDAPLDDEPETEEELLAVEQALRSGEFIEGAAVSDRIAARGARGG